MTVERHLVGRTQAATAVDDRSGRDVAAWMAQALGADRCERLQQVHGTTVRRAGVALPGDAILSSDAGTAVAIVTADCVPLLLAAAGGRHVAAVHAGWRGAAAGIVEKAFRALVAEAGSAGATSAWIGPAAGGCCYEVGDEVVEALRAGAAGEERGAMWLLPGRRERPHVDLRAYVAAQLRALGIAPEDITRRPECTICDSKWPSYRRQGKAAGRLWSAIRPSA